MQGCLAAKQQNEIVDVVVSSSYATDHRERHCGYDESSLPAGGKETARTVAQHAQGGGRILRRDAPTAAPQGVRRGRERDTGGA